MEEDISKPDLYVCKTSLSISDEFISTSSVGEQPSLSVVHLSSSTASSNEKYTREKIQHLLKYNKTQYVVLGNLNNQKSSICWRSFGFPAKLDSNDIPQKIEGFVLSKSCFITYSYISNSTTFLSNGTVSSGIQFLQYRQSLNQLMTTLFTARFYHRDKFLSTCFNIKRLIIQIESANLSPPLSDLSAC
jgi:hypothetical protein